MARGRGRQHSNINAAKATEPVAPENSGKAEPPVLSEQKQPKASAHKYKKMQKVYFKGGRHYREPDGEKPTSVPREAGEAIVADAAKGKHPYFLVGYGGARDRVNGWVDAELVEDLHED